MHRWLPLDRRQGHATCAPPSQPSGHPPEWKPVKQPPSARALASLGTNVATRLLMDGSATPSPSPCARTRTQAQTRSSAARHGAQPPQGATSCGPPLLAGHGGACRPATHHEAPRAQQRGHRQPRGRHGARQRGGQQHGRAGEPRDAGRQHALAAVRVRQRPAQQLRGHVAPQERGLDHALCVRVWCVWGPGRRRGGAGRATWPSGEQHARLRRRVPRAPAGCLTTQTPRPWG